jgi:broad specificity phosphatase PhoE
VHGQASAVGGTTNVILVRHAEKDLEPEGDPVLSAAGSARAQLLAERLAGQNVSGIMVTEYARTRLTAEPLATRLGVSPEVFSARAGFRAHALEIAEAIRSRFAGRTVLVVGHSNTLPAIVTALGAPPVEPICDGSYTNLYIVRIQPDGRAAVEHESFGAPDPADACAEN